MTMPIIVNELVFKGTIAEATGNDRMSQTPARQPKLDKKALVEACVEEVLKILEREKER